MHAIQMAFERVHVGGPEAAELREPGVYLLKTLRFQAVEAPLRVHRGFHEAGVAQHAQVLGYSRLGHAEAALDLSDGLLRRNQQAQDGPAIRLGNNFKGRFHGLGILRCVYACQGI